MTDAGRYMINQRLRSASRIPNSQEKRSLNHTSTDSTFQDHMGRATCKV